MIWERYADLEGWSTWAPQIDGVEANSRRLQAGLRGTVCVAAGLVRLPFEVDDVDEHARTWSWRVSIGPITLALGHGVDARESGGRAWLTTTGPAVVVLPYLPLACLALGSLVRPRSPTGQQ